MVHFQKLTVQSRATENLRKLRINSRSRSRHVTNVSRRRNCHKSRISHSLLHLLSQAIPVQSRLLVYFHLHAAIFRQFINRINWKKTLTPTAACECWIAAQFFCQVSRLIDGVIANKLRQLINQIVRFFRFVAITQLLQHVRKTHNPEANRSSLLIRMHRFWNWRLSDVAQIVQLSHSRTSRFFQSIPIPSLIFTEKRRQINAHQITRRNVVFILWQCNFRAQVTEVNCARIVI